MRKSSISQISYLRKLKLYTSIFLFVVTSKLHAQMPTNAVGPWNNPSGPYITAALYNAGVGVISPEGKLEVKYQPCNSTQNGLIVTSLGCTTSQVSNYNILHGDAFATYPGDPNLPMPATPPLSFSAAFAATCSTLQVINLNDRPMFWVRDENPSGSTLPGLPNTTQTTYDTKFIVMPNGNTGINTSNPRGTLDVVQFGLGSSNTPTAVFGKTAAGTQTPFNGLSESGTAITTTLSGYRTSQIMIYNRLPAKNYNRIIQEKDQAILFTDGLNSDGGNQSGALVIAPWDPNYSSTSSTVGGIRIDKDGKVEVHGDLRATKLTINAKWWADYVFNDDYKLISLDEVRVFIKNNGHLPGIPSTKEILESGLDVSEIIALQQKKLEECVLYAIAQEDKFKEQQLELQKLKEKQAEIEAKLNLLLKK